MAEDKFKEPLSKAEEEARAALDLAFDLSGVRHELMGRECLMLITDVVVTKRASPPGADIHLIIAREAVWKNVLEDFFMDHDWRFVTRGVGYPYYYKYSEGTTLLLCQQS